MSEIKFNPLDVAVSDISNEMSPVFDTLSQIILSEDYLSDNIELNYEDGKVQLIGNEGDVITETAISGGSVGSVTSVNGKTGAVVITATDIDVYTKSEVDAAIGVKVDTTVVDAIDTRLGTAETKLATVTEGAEVNVQSDWNVTDVDSDAFILNKPTIPSIDGLATTEELTSGLALKANVADVYTKLEVDTAVGAKADTTVVDAIDTRLGAAETKLATVTEGAEVNVQSDWNVADVDSDAFILNKPVIPSIDGLATTESVNAGLALKANVADVYTKSEVDTAIGVKADASVVDAVDTRLGTAEGEIDDLQSKVGASVVNSVTAADKSISIGGTLSNPSVSVKIDTTATAGNVLLTVTDEGLKGSVNITQFQIKVVDTLPAVGESLYYYLLETATADVYEEYVWAEVEADVFEFIKLGDTSVDLSGYVTTEDLNNALATKANVADVYTKLEVDTAVGAKVDTAVVDAIDTRLGAAETKLATVAEGAEVNVQSDWNVADVDSDAFILNKPIIPSIDGLATTESVDAGLALKANVVDVYTKSEVDTAIDVKADVTVVDAIDTRLGVTETKLATVAEGAEVNVQSDWNVTDVDSDAFILNKPTIPSIDGLATTEELTSGLALKANVADVYTKLEVDTAVGAKVDTTVVDAIDTRLGTAETKLATVAEGAEVNVQSDWNVTDVDSDAFILNKPTIPSTFADVYIGRHIKNNVEIIYNDYIPGNYVKGVVRTTADNEEIIISPYVFNGTNNVVDWGDGTPETDDTRYHTYATAGDYNVVIKSGDIALGINSNSFVSITDLSYNNADASYLFSNSTNLTEINGLDKLNSSTITSIKSMFENCSSLTMIDLSGFDATNVTNVDNMVSGCTSVTLAYGKTQSDCDKFNASLNKPASLTFTVK